MPNLLGTAPNQVPTNADLGKLAFMDVVDTVTNNPYLDTAISDTKPSLLLDFANSKTLDPRITYTRASTASYYDGKTTAVAEQNLLAYSQDFDNTAWSKNATTITTNATAAPDGSTTADTITASAGAAYHYVFGSGSASSGNFVFSVYVKKSTTDFVSVNVCDGSSGSRYAAATFNLTTVASTQNAVLGTGISITSASIVSVGGSWYRLILTGSSTTYPMNTVFVSLNSSGTPTYNTGFYGLETWTAAGTEAAYLWGAQLEQRSSVSSYTATTSSPITNYIPALQTAAAGVPRFDHDPVTGESKGFLIEEQRTNLLTYSDQFDNAAWAKTNATIIANTVIAPDGTLTSDYLVDNTTSGTHFLSQTGTGGAANYTMSIYAKAGARSFVYLIDYSTVNVYAFFNLSTGVVGTIFGPASATITNVGNGWYRCTMTLTTTGTPVLRVGVSQSDNVRTYAGDGYSGIYIWGAQLEAGSFATSYIPTTSAQVTRSADAASMTGANFSSWYRADEGTIYSEATASSTSMPFCLRDSSGNSYIAVISRTSNVAFEVYNNLSLQAELGVAVLQSKTAGAYKTNDFAASVNSRSTYIDASGTVPLVSSATIGSYATNSLVINGTIKKLAYYPKRLSDAELQEMTQ